MFLPKSHQIIWNKKIKRHDLYSTGTPIQHLALLPLNLSKSNRKAYPSFS